MSLKSDNSFVEITCDKCGKKETAPNDGHSGEYFFDSGWRLSMRAKKYMHKCYDCLTKYEKQAIEFVKILFP